MNRSKLSDVDKVSLVMLWITARPARPPCCEASDVSRVHEAAICVDVRLYRRLVGDRLFWYSEGLVSAAGNQIAEGVGCAPIKTSVVAQKILSLAFK